MGFSVFPSSDFNFYKSPVVRHNVTSSTNLSIPSDVNVAYAVLYSGGSGGNGTGISPGGPTFGTNVPGSAGTLGNVAIGLTPIANSVTIGAGGNGGAGANQSTQPAGSGFGAGNAGGTTIFGSLMTGATGNFSSNNARVLQPRNSANEGRFAADGLNTNPGAAGAAGSGNGASGGAGGNGAAVILY